MGRPRLLPVTMAAMVVLFGAKAIDLVEALRPTLGLPVPRQPPGTAAATEVAAPRSPSSACPPPQTAALSNGGLGVAPISDAERAVLLDLRQRRAQLDAREQQIGAHEKLLAASEHRLTTRLDELTALQARLQALEDVRRQHDEANWAGLVKVYEAMRPRDAATIFNDLDMAVLLPVVDRMNERKAAAILAAMDAAKARILTAALAQTRLRANTIQPAKGA